MAVTEEAKLIVRNGFGNDTDPVSGFDRVTALDQLPNHLAGADFPGPLRSVIDQLMRVEPHALIHSSLNVDGVDRIVGRVAGVLIRRTHDAAAANAATGQ